MYGRMSGSAKTSMVSRRAISDPITAAAGVLTSPVLGRAASTGVDDCDRVSTSHLSGRTASRSPAADKPAASLSPALRKRLGDLASAQEKHTSEELRARFAGYTRAPKLGQLRRNARSVTPQPRSQGSTGMDTQDISSMDAGGSPFSSHGASLSVASSPGASRSSLVRSFAITSKGLVKQGSSLALPRTLSYCQPSPDLSRSPSPSRIAAAVGISTRECEERDVHPVVMMGGPGVGKRSLIREFILPGCDPFQSMCSDDDATEHNVSIRLNGQQATLNFIDHTDEEEFEDKSTTDAYVIVFSVEDRESFETAQERMLDLRQKCQHRKVAKILVANKTDLVRCRVVLPDEAKLAAEENDCKYIEVSAAIDLQIEELLVGILQQIRLTHTQNRLNAMFPDKRRHNHKYFANIKHNNPISKLLRARKSTIMSKSCDNLYVL